MTAVLPTTTPQRTGGPGRAVPGALVALSVIPRRGRHPPAVPARRWPEVLPADPRFAGLALPLVVHIARRHDVRPPRSPPVRAPLPAAALDLAPPGRAGARRRRPVRGRLGALDDAGLRPKPGTGDLLFVLRLTFASAMAGFLVLGFNAARRRDIPAHRAWMVRAYAIGLAAGTQAFTEGIGGALWGSGVVRDDLAKGAGGSSTSPSRSGPSAAPARRSPELTAQPLEVAQHPRARRAARPRR